MDNLGLSQIPKSTVVLFTKTGVSGFKPAITIQQDGTTRSDGVVFSFNHFDYAVAYGQNGLWPIMIVNDTIRVIGNPSKQVIFALGVEYPDGTLGVTAPRAFHPKGFFLEFFFDVVK